MDSSFSFTPLWDEHAIVHKPEKELDALHAKVIEMVIRHTKLPEKGNAWGIDGLSMGVSIAIRRVLGDFAIKNEVLDTIRSTAIKLTPSGSPFDLINATLVLWYLEAVSVIHGHHQARRQKSGPDLPQPWLSGYTNIFPLANLGFMTMLRGLQEWLHPKHPKLQAVCLISKVTMAVLYITYTVGPQLEDFPWKLIPHMPVTEARKLFYRLFISVAGNPYNDGTIMTTPPAFEYNVTQEDVRISHCGKKLLVKVYMDETWHRVPAWHPYFKLPGSPWNNYIKNSEQPTFLSTPRSTAIKYELPSSALVIALEFRTKYFTVRDVYEENGLARLSDEKRDRQLRRLSRRTGRKYASESPSDASAYSMVGVLDEYLYHAPVIQKPRADAGGHLTLPFMSTTVHAAQREDDPLEIEDFFIMIFEQELA
ncbi:hypothetical protein HG530_001914 [Fusarium avenaceum]|nr:mating type 1-1-2 protein [Fusarium avenaceum]KAI6775156.1 hypothetical protein HG530_001914 [Fusarium avenaceum]